MGERGTPSLQIRTAKSFGFEWSKFSAFYKEYERNFWDSVFVKPESLIDNHQWVLDAGCGAGRNTAILSKWAHMVSAYDFSEKAVAAASFNTRSLHNVFVRQADIYNLPDTCDNFFNHVFCIGVLHHLPDPELGFKKLVGTVIPGGAISIWVYGNKDNLLALKVYEPVRKLTTRIPHPILYWLSLFPALFVQLCNVIRLPLFKHYSAFPFRTKWNDAFDMLSAPSAKYYTPGEIKRWYEDAGLKDIRVEYRYMNKKAKGIRAFGVK
jgi:SAM-dependent methyltransferase